MERQTDAAAKYNFQESLPKELPSMTNGAFEARNTSILFGIYTLTHMLSLQHSHTSHVGDPHQLLYSKTHSQIEGTKLLKKRKCFLLFECLPSDFESFCRLNELQWE